VTNAWAMYSRIARASIGGCETDHQGEPAALYHIPSRWALRPGITGRVADIGLGVCTPVAQGLNQSGASASHQDSRATNHLNRG